MRHENSVFHALSKHIPWAMFDRLVDEHGADRRVRRLSTKSQLIALLYGQLSGAASLREIEKTNPEFGACTLSMGIAESPHHGTTVSSVLAAADNALYRAKRGGRNTVEVAES